MFYYPLYGDNANIVGYISETGTLAAQYVYDPYGNIIETYGSSPNLRPPMRSRDRSVLELYYKNVSGEGLPVAPKVIDLY